MTENSAFKVRFMASGPITSWHKDGETMETMRNLIGRRAPKSLNMVSLFKKLKYAFSLEEMC